MRVREDAPFERLGKIDGAEREIRTPEGEAQRFSRPPPYRAWLSRLEPPDMITLLNIFVHRHEDDRYSGADQEGQSGDSWNGDPLDGDQEQCTGRMADALDSSHVRVIEANRKDLEEAEGKIPQALYKRTIESSMMTRLSTYGRNEP